MSAMQMRIMRDTTLKSPCKEWERSTRVSQENIKVLKAVPDPRQIHPCNSYRRLEWEAKCERKYMTILIASWAV